MVKASFAEKRCLLAKVAVGPVRPIPVFCPGVQTLRGLRKWTFEFRMESNRTLGTVQLVILLRSSRLLWLNRTSLTGARWLKPLLIFPTIVTVRCFPHRITVPLLRDLDMILTLGTSCNVRTPGLRLLKIPLAMGATPSLGLNVAKQLEIRSRKLPKMERA